MQAQGDLLFTEGEPNPVLDEPGREDRRHTTDQRVEMECSGHGFILSARAGSW
jgi:hypothetical protein